jgi:hypothetical protein
MKRVKVVLGFAVAVVLVGVVVVVVTGDQGKNNVRTAATPASSVGLAATAPERPIGGAGGAAMTAAAKAGKYLFVFFSKEDDENTAAMKRVFDAAMSRVSSKADAVMIRVTDGGEKGIVEKYGVTKAPMPLVLVLAPNGAVTGGFPGKFEEKTLLDAFVSPGMEKCLKVLQEGKLVLVCAQNRSTKSNDAATKAAQDFKADARFAKFTEIVQIDPADEHEAKFVAQLRIEPMTGEALTALLAPPGAVVGVFPGEVKKDAMVAALVAATSGGCGPSGCAPPPDGGPSACPPTGGQ